MRRAAAAALVLAMLAAGCDEGPPKNVKHIKVANPYHDQLTALSEPMQRLGLMRAIRDNGKRCHKVEVARYQQDYRDMAMWVAMCDDGRHWAIFIAPNGDTQLRECTQMAQLRLPQCHPLTVPPNPNEAATP